MNNRRLALHALKRKRQYEKWLCQIDGTLSSIEIQIMTLENASTNAEVLSVMGQSAKALKAAQNHMDVEEMHRLMDDISKHDELPLEMRFLFHLLSIAGVAQSVGAGFECRWLSRLLGFGSDVDENELLSELEELEREDCRRTKSLDTV